MLIDETIAPGIAFVMGLIFIPLLLAVTNRLGSTPS